MSLPPRTEPGRLLDGRYRLLTHLADGGMASVWLALDERLEREVALKIMRSGLAADPEFVERFRQEARSAARLSHPGLVAMFDQGRDGDDMFLVMEFVPGRTLRQLVTDEAPVGPGPALDIIDRVLDALAAAHRAGMVHRDVKPENVIVRHDGSLKVADFGLTRAVAAATTGGQPGVLLGTVSYLSPEQVEHGSADARSDVYACGLILYELLTGRKAFDGETAIHV
ncbi:MAG TPA: protein kinase, partial [Dermatophilaceae bacterium]|nr:protein kinase [Dermatophilaceae bacterium]